MGRQIDFIATALQVQCGNRAGTRLVSPGEWGQAGLMKLLSVHGAVCSLWQGALCGLSYPTMIKLLAVRRSPHYTLQITVQISGFTFETLASNHSLVLHQSSHTAALSCSGQTWGLGHEAVTFSALHLSFCLQASVCSCLTFDEHRSLLLCCAGGHRSGSLMGLIAFLEAAQALWWGKVTLCPPFHQVGGNRWQAALISNSQH